MYKHDLAISGFLLRLKSICIKHSNLNTTNSGKGAKGTQTYATPDTQRE